MAVYDWDITPAEVLAAVGFSPSTANADPDTTQLTAWIKQFSGRVVNVMVGLDVTAANITTTTDDALYQECRGVITGRCAASWYIANQRDLSEYAQHLIDEYDEFLTNLRTRPSFTTGSTGHGLTPRSGSSSPRTYLDTTDPDRQPLWINKTDGFN